MCFKKLVVILSLATIGFLGGCDQNSGGGITEVVNSAPKDSAAPVVVPYTILATSVDDAYLRVGDNPPPVSKYTGKIYTFRNASEWFPYWVDFVERREGAPISMPNVDFNQNMIVALRNTSFTPCNPTEIIVEQKGGKIVISRKALPSRSDILCVQVLSTSIVLMSLPMTSLPVESQDQY